MTREKSSGRPRRRVKKKVLETPKYHHLLGISRKSHSGYSSPRDHTFVPSSLRTSPVPNKRGASFGGISLSFFSTNKQTHTHTHKREKRAQQRGIREPLSRARALSSFFLSARARRREREREREKEEKNAVWGNCEKCLFFSKIQTKEREKREKKNTQSARKVFLVFKTKEEKTRARRTHTRKNSSRARWRERGVCVSVCLSACALVGSRLAL